MRFPGIVISCTDSSLLSLAWSLLCPGLQRGRPCVSWLSWEGKEITAWPVGYSATQTFRNREIVLKSKMNAGNLGWWSLQRNLSKRRMPCQMEGTWTWAIWVWTNLDLQADGWHLDVAPVARPRERGPRLQAGRWGGRWVNGSEPFYTQELTVYIVSSFHHTLQGSIINHHYPF